MNYHSRLQPKLIIGPQSLPIRHEENASISRSAIFSMAARSPNSFLRQVRRRRVFIGLLLLNRRSLRTRCLPIKFRRSSRERSLSKSSKSRTSTHRNLPDQFQKSRLLLWKLSQTLNLLRKLLNCLAQKQKRERDHIYP